MIIYFAAAKTYTGQKKLGIKLLRMHFLDLSIINEVLNPCADPENFLSGVQIPRRGLTENFNIAKTNNLAIPGEGGVRTPLPPPPPPLDPPMESYGGCYYICAHFPKISFAHIFHLRAKM